MKKSLKILSRVVIVNFIFFSTFILTLNKQPIQSKTQVAVKNKAAKTAYSEKIQADSTPTDPPNLLSQLTQHNNRNSCWFIIDGSLYDITTFFGSHPGGDDIMLKYCGTDASTGFHTKDQIIPADHSGSAKAMLQQYLIQ